MNSPKEQPVFEVLPEAVGGFFSHESDTHLCRAVAISLISSLPRKRL
jgi:hypothetical protein